MGQRKVETKKWYASKTVWGGLIAVASATAGLFGVYIDEQTQAQITDLALVGAGAVGGLIAIWGRIKADKEIK